MIVLICPGFHSPRLTTSFLNNFDQTQPNYQWLIFPADKSYPYSPAAIVDFWEASVTDSQLKQPVIIIAFSAGVVGAIGAAWALSWRQVPVKAIIALDGWGVPLFGPFPIHRVSHDYYTHWSSQLLGAGGDSFYAERPVEHLELWESPQTAKGWWVKTDGVKVATTAAVFIRELLNFYSDGVTRRLK